MKEYTFRMDSRVLEAIIPFCLLLPVVWLGVSFSYAITGPISKAATTHPSRKFLLSDLLWLFVLLQLPLALLLFALSDIAGGLLAGVAVAAMLVASFAWLRGILTLSRLQIYSPIRRAAYTLLVLPVALTVPAILFPAFVIVLAMTWDDGRSILFCAVSIGIISTAAYGFRKISLWILNGSKLLHSRTEPQR